MTIAKQAKGTRARWIAASAVVVGGALAGLVLLTRAEAPQTPDAPVLSRLEQEAVARFAGVDPYVTMPDGSQLKPTNAAHILSMKVNAYKVILARESEARDPTFPLKAEAELGRRQPMRAAIVWNDVTGNREMNFTVEDSSQCGLGGKTELTLGVEDLAHYPCLNQNGNAWDAGTRLTVQLTPIVTGDPLWPELLSSTKKTMAAEEHLAQLNPVQGS